MRCVKLFILSAVVASFSFLPNRLALADRNIEVERLKQELLELEKITQPFIQTFRKVSLLVSPSVVSLSTEKKDSLSNSQNIKPPLPDQNFPPKRDNHPENVPKKGLGSGIIVDDRGYILTNNHVIGGFAEDEITVVDYAGEQYKNVKIIGVDPNTDLAVIKIEGEDFQPVEFGNSEEVQVGDWVIAIGSPFGYQQTVSTGIISAKGRTHVIPLVLPFVYEDFFQTDAAINPGNSGGPLIDSKGAVIGVNSAIIPFAQGIGFAIPIQSAIEIADQLIKHGEIVRPWISINAVDVNPKMVAYYNMPTTKGVVVTDVVKGSEADKSGIEVADILIRMEDIEINNVRDLIKVLNKHKVGDRVAMEFFRGHEKVKLKTVLEKAPSMQHPPAPR